MEPTSSSSTRLSTGSAPTTGETEALRADHTDSSLVLTGPLVSLQADSELVCGHGEHAGSVVGAERGESVVGKH